MAKIRLDGQTQSRIALSEDVIVEYAGLMKGGYQFPPLLVVFDGASYWLVDGFHRRWAAVKAKVKDLKCIVLQGTRDDARWISYGANKDHGLPRSNPDKKRAVLAALKHPNGAKWSDGKIGEHVGVSQRMVTKYRQELTPTQKDSESPTREGRDGRTTNTANIGETDETKIKRLAAKGLSVREIAESVGWSKSRVARFLRTTESASGTKTGSRGTDDEQDDEPETPLPARTSTAAATSASQPAQQSDCENFKQFKPLWGKASKVEKCLIRDYIETNP